MPLQSTTNRTYITIDPDAVEFKQKVGDDKYITSPVYTGYLKDVQWQENEYQGRPNNRFLFVFEDEYGNEEIVQSGDSSLFSTALINKLLSVEGVYGHFRIGIYESEGGYIVPWVEHNGDGDNKLQEKYGFDQFNRMADRSFNGDKTALIKKLFETELTEKLEKQGTQVEMSSGEVGPDPQSVESVEKVDMSADIDDDLPF